MWIYTIFKRGYRILIEVFSTVHLLGQICFFVELIGRVLHKNKKELIRFTVSLCLFFSHKLSFKKNHIRII